ncbi:MAG: GNAT family N-acetyltransferase [Planctomycetota bacterium]
MTAPRAPHRPAARRDVCLRTVAPFGLTLGGEPLRPPVDRRAIGRLASARSGAVVLITGPSGSGKSRLLAGLADRLGPVSVAPPVRLGSRSPAEWLARSGASDPWPLLAACGLAEARLAVRPADRLSEGERARLGIAVALARAVRVSKKHGSAFVLLDEFCSVLDRVTAAGVAATVRRWARRFGDERRVRIVAATGHEDMPRLLGPDTIVRTGARGAAQIEPGPKRWRPALTIAVERGAITDFDALESLHYRAGRPATWSRVLRAVGAGGELAGVLVLSYPVLNAAWRESAWPGRYRTGLKRADARRVNRELRCISRVVVEPRYRGLGVARKLVEAAMASSETPALEAVAAMGPISPFFERAGMVAVPIERRAADWRLLDALDAAGIVQDGAHWRLADGTVQDAMVGDVFVRAELKRWGRNVGASVRDRVRTGDAIGLARAAAERLMAEPVGYAWARG